MDQLDGWSRIIRKASGVAQKNARPSIHSDAMAVKVVCVIRRIILFGIRSIELLGV